LADNEKIKREEHMTEIQAVSDADFKEKVLGSDLPVVLLFKSPGCAKCAQLLSQIQEMAPEFTGRFRIMTLDLSDGPETAAEYEVMGLPTLLIFKDGELAAEYRGGVKKEELRSRLSSL